MWYQLKIEHSPLDAIDELSNQLEEQGALSIMLTDKADNPVFEPELGTTPLWPEVIIQALYADAVQAQEMRTQLEQTRPGLSISLDVLPDQDWERACMDDFKPQPFGQRLWVCPSWCTPPDPDAVNLILDPGLAFGTGTHPTTGLCLSWLEQAHLNNKTLIDYGCGSGILALAAIKLGAAHVFAADIDEQALQATHNNAMSNEINETQLAISLPDALTQPADILIANILLSPLMTLASRFQELLHPEGLLVVSGLLEDQQAQLIEAYSQHFSLAHQETRDGWALLVFTHLKRQSP